MELNHLKYFYEVAKLGSFTKASKSLRVSQPSISKMVKLLEDREGVKLLDRTRRGGVHLTPVGKRFYESCASIFQEIENLKGALEHGSEECVGELSMGASDNLCNYVLPDVLDDFLKTHPRISLRLLSGTSENIKSELLASKIELGLYYTATHEPGFDVQALGFVEFVIVHGGGVHGGGKRRRLTTDDLKGIPYIGSRIVDYAKAYPALDMLKSVGVRPATIIETNNQETQKRFALKGYGYTVVPKFMVRHEVGRGELQIVQTSRRLGSKLYLVQRKSRTLSRPAQLFKAHLKHGAVVTS